MNIEKKQELNPQTIHYCRKCHKPFICGCTTKFDCKSDIDIVSYQQQGGNTIRIEYYCDDCNLNAILELDDE